MLRFSERSTGIRFAVLARDCDPVAEYRDRWRTEDHAVA
jgi:hypothetical protein